MRDPTPLPRFAWVLGLGGLIPFAALAGASWLASPTWGAPAALALLQYGATILAFLGAVHWGLALRAAPPESGSMPWRYGLGVLPALVAWGALSQPIVPGLVLLAVGIMLTLAAEAAAARRGLVPGGYLRLRIVLSLGAAFCLLAGAAALIGIGL